jgi:hypothetical protein
MTAQRSRDRRVPWWRWPEDPRLGWLPWWSIARRLAVCPLLYLGLVVCGLALLMGWGVGAAVGFWRSNT